MILKEGPARLVIEKGYTIAIILMLLAGKIIAGLNVDSAIKYLP
jgi:hypothetical protein